MGIFLTILLLLITFFSFGQKTDTLKNAHKENRPVKVSLLSNYYEQDGEHSAVNGGIGSQKLKSYASEALIYIPIADSSGMKASAGMDYYTSASLLDIDKYATSASNGVSKISGDETRYFGNLGFDFANKKRNAINSISVGYSQEYDVTSANASIGKTKHFPKRNITFLSNLSFIADRWMVVYPGEFRYVEPVATYGTGASDSTGSGSGSRPLSGSGSGSGSTTSGGSDNPTSGGSSTSGNTDTVDLPNAVQIPISGKTITKNGKVYPVDWRYSYAFNNEIQFVINKRTNMSVGLDLVYQQGLLSTPFHRVYFRDGVTEQFDKEVRIEKLPRERMKAALFTRFNKVVNTWAGIRLHGRFYIDSWDIQGLTLSAETPLHLTKWMSLTPFYRIHSQTASKYFAAYDEHVYTPGSYYTSDYDLSKLVTQKIGATLRLKPLGKITGIMNEEGTKYLLGLSEINIRYAYFKRSDGLKSDIITLLLDFEF